MAIPIEWIPRNPTLGNFAHVLASDGIYRALLNSVLVTAGSVVVVLVSSSMAAFAFAKIKFKGRDALFIVYLATLMIPFQVLFIPMFLVMIDLNLLDNLWALILPGVFRMFAIFMLRQRMLAIPDAYLEAAAIDGAGLFRQFAQIVIPMCKTELIVLLIMQSMDSWNDFLLPLVMLTSRENFTLPIILNAMAGQYQTEFHLLMAGALISIIPILMVYAFAQKFFTAGLQLGGVKG